MIASASSGTTSHTTCSMISRESLAMASYSGPRAARAATFWSTADDTAAAIAGGAAAAAPREKEGGTGVGALRMAGDACGTPAAGVGAKRGTTGRTPGAPAAGTAGVIGTRTGPDAAGAVGVATTGARTAGVGGCDTAGIAAGVGLEMWGTAGTIGAGAGGLGAASGGLIDGNPIMVRATCGRAAVEVVADAIGCGVPPVRAIGIDAEGRAPGISDGRGDGCAGGGVGSVAGIGRAPDGRVGGLVLQAGAAGDWVGPRSMVISP